MSATMQSVCDLSRGDMNDANKVRYPDSELIKFANDGIAKALVMRPDLNYGNYTQAYADRLLTDDFPLTLEYRDPIAQYITMRAQTADDEFVNENRATQALKAYLVGLGLGG